MAGRPIVPLFMIFFRVRHVTRYVSPLTRRPAFNILQPLRSVTLLDGN